MTVTSPPSGITAHRRGRPTRARRGPERGRTTWARRLVAATVAVGFAAATALGAAPGRLGGVPAQAASATPTPTPTPSGTVHLTLSPLSDGVVDAGDSLAVSFTVTNDTLLPLPAGELILQLGAKAFTDRVALSAWLAGDTSGVSTRPVADALADPVDATGSITNGAVVASTDPALHLRPGVYPLLATYERSNERLTSTSVMIVPRTGGKVTPVGVVVPITADALSSGLLDAQQLTALTAADGTLSEQLDAVTGTAAILAVDPAIPAAIRVLGDAAPPDAVAWLDRLLALPNQRFALQFGDADIASQLASGLSSPLQPTALNAYMSADDFPTPKPTAGPEPTPTPTPTTGQTSFPGLDELLDIGGGRASVYWPAGGTADASVVTKLGTLGDDGTPSITLIPSATVAKAGTTVTASATAGGASALVYDAAVSTALNEASTTTDSALRGRPLAAATALLALASASAGDAPLLVTVDRAVERSRVSLSAAIEAATALPATRTASLRELVDATPKALTVTAAAPDKERVAAATALRRDEKDVSSFATILEDPTLLTGTARAELLQVLGAAWIPTPDLWRQAYDAHRTATQQTLGAVGVVPPSHINLATTGSSLPYWVRNDLPYPVRVVLAAIPDDLRLDVERFTQVPSAEASSNTKVLVPVQASVGSGEVTIRLQLRSPTGVDIGAPQFSQVTVRAEWEGIGVAVILILVGGLIAVGLVRTVLRRRGARRATDAAGPPPGGDAA